VKITMGLCFALARRLAGCLMLVVASLSRTIGEESTDLGDRRPIWLLDVEIIGIAPQIILRGLVTFTVSVAG
jgi:hypothetical protein